MNRRWVKIGLGVVGGLVVVLALALFFIDYLIRVAVERGGSHALGVPVHVEEADLNWTDRSLVLDGMRIENPPGYTDPDFFQAKRVYAKLDVSSLFSDEVDVEQIRVEEPTIWIQKKGGSSNLKEITGSLSDDAKKEPAGEEDPAKPVKLSHLLIEGASVHMRSPLTAGKAVSVTVGKVELRDLGGKEGEKLRIGQVIGLVVNAVLTATLDKGKGIIPGDLDDVLIDGVTRLTSEVFKGVKGVIVGIGKIGAGIGGGVKKGLQSIFGSGSEEKTEEPKEETQENGTDSDDR